MKIFVFLYFYTFPGIRQGKHSLGAAKTGRRPGKRDAPPAASKNKTAGFAGGFSCIGLKNLFRHVGNFLGEVVHFLFQALALFKPDEAADSDGTAQLLGDGFHVLTHGNFVFLDIGLI